MTGKLDKALLKAVLEPRRPGALEKISSACAAGADPNMICPETSTAAGFVPGGSTLLTQAIRACESKAVARLLGSGADPNLADQNGWTPWIASTLADESKRRRIQASLVEHGAEQVGDHIGELARAIAGGDVDRAGQLNQSPEDFKILSTFRVDLVGHQIRSGNARMLEYLLESGMSPSSTNLSNAVRNGNTEAVDVLLRHGMAPEKASDNETQLMVAASLGHRAIAELLIGAGADASRYSGDNEEYTPAFYARQAGHAELADWLQSQMSDDAVARQATRDADRNPKFATVYAQATSGETCSTEDIVAVLTRWDEAFGVTVVDANPSTVVVRLESLPESLDELIADLEALAVDGSEDRNELRQALTGQETLTLWWD